MTSESHNVMKEDLVVVLYWALLLVEGVAEAAWLRRKDGASWIRSLSFAWLSNLLGFCIGFALLFVSVGVAFMLAWDGSMSKLPFKGNEVVGVLLLVVLIMPIVLALIKRGLLALLKLRRGGRAWAFSFVSALIFWLLPLAVTALVTKLLWRFL
jgi:hypothetical protein